MILYSKNINKIVQLCRFIGGILEAHAGVIA